MANWTYYVHRSNDGEPIGELPLRDVNISDVISGRSSLTGTLPLFEPKAARAYTAPWLREISAVRDGVCAFNGPIVTRVPDVGSNGRDLQITANDPMAYFSRRVTEHAHRFSREQFSMMRVIMQDALDKTGGALYRLSLGSGDSGVIKKVDIGGTDRQYVSDIIDSLASDADTGFDFRWDYTWDARFYVVHRRFVYGYPVLGRDLSTQVFVEVNRDLLDFNDTEDGTVAANRVHALGGVVKNVPLRGIANSGTSLNNGYPLLETIIDASDITDQTRLNAAAKNALRVLLPSPRKFESTHQIGPTMPYGKVDLGDTITLNINAGVEQVNMKRRVIQIDTDPTTDTVKFTYFSPQDDVLT